MPQLSPLFTEILRDRPSAYWPCDGPGVPPEVRARYTLTASGSPNYHRRVIVPGDSALVDFPGAAYFAGPTGSLTYHSGASGVMSIETVVRPDQLLSAMMLVTKGNSSAYEYDLRIGSGGEAHFGTSISTTGADVMVVESAAGTLAVGRVAHFVGVYDRAKPYIAVFVNGRLKASSTSASGNSSATGSAFQIGHRADAGGNTLDGGLGHVAVYNYRLSPARIAAHYQAFRHAGTARRQFR